jgi:steroid 5-alpha reductase family enzyme
MGPMVSVLAQNLLAILVMMLLVWILSLLKKDASIVDVFWGLGFVLVVWLTFPQAHGYAGRRLTIAALTTAWGLRLAIHILVRDRGKGEDRRYQAWRGQHGDQFWWVSLFTVFGLQALLLWLISLVLQVGMLSPIPAKLTWMDGLGVLIWAVGFSFEAISDWQLLRFTNDPKNRGKVMTQGLWAYSRHPNYFGESLIWWGMYCITLTNLENAWTVISPLIITFLLLKVSGVTLLEKTIVESRPGYREYAKRTPVFIPRFPKKDS